MIVITEAESQFRAVLEQYKTHSEYYIAVPCDGSAPTLQYKSRPFSFANTSCQKSNEYRLALEHPSQQPRSSESKPFKGKVNLQSKNPEDVAQSTGRKGWDQGVPTLRKFQGRSPGTIRLRRGVYSTKYPGPPRTTTDKRHRRVRHRGRARSITRSKFRFHPECLYRNRDAIRAPTADPERARSHAHT